MGVRKPIRRTGKPNDERYTTTKTMGQIFDITNIAKFDLDPCGAFESHKAENYFTKEFDGLKHDWFGSVFINPPFSNIEPWIIKSFDEIYSGNCRHIVMLVPANRTEQPWWQNWIEANRDKGGKLRTVFLGGRTKFGSPGDPEGLLTIKKSPPFACCLLIWRT